MKLPEFLGHLFTLGFIVTTDRIYRILTRSKDLEKTLLASHLAPKMGHQMFRVIKKQKWIVQTGLECLEKEKHCSMNANASTIVLSHLVCTQQTNTQQTNPFGYS